MAIDEKAKASQEVAQDAEQPESVAISNERSKEVFESSAGSREIPGPAQTEAPPNATPKPASVLSQTIIVVPRSKRRGLLGNLTVIPEIEQPYNYANSTKWGITLVVAISSAAAPLGSAIFFREFRRFRRLVTC
jgi:hypothetical protein